MWPESILGGPEAGGNAAIAAAANAGMGAVIPSNLDSSGSVDNAATIQAAIDTGAPIIYLPALAGSSRSYLVNTTLQLGTAQRLVGAPMAALAIGGASQKGSYIKFRGTGAAIKNKTGATACGVDGLVIDLNSAAQHGVAFVSSYANEVKNVIFTGTMGTGVYLDLTYVCLVENITFNGCSVKWACVYAGETNASVFRRIHTSTTPQDTSLAMCGIALKTGNANTIDSAILQGPTIGISLKNPTSTQIINPYSENCLCSMRIGDPNTPHVSGVHIQGGYIGPVVASHSQYASRGPMIYVAAARGVSLGNGIFFNGSNATDSSTYPIICGDATSYSVMHIGAHYGVSNFTVREMIYLETASGNPLVWGAADTKDANRTVEMFLKRAGSSGGVATGLQFNSSNAAASTTWTPTVMTGTVNSLLKQAFVTPTAP